MALNCPLFLKCKEHGRYCFIKTGTTSYLNTYKQSFYICSQTNPCSFKQTARIDARKCPEHPTEIVELQAFYDFTPENVRYYYRCNIGKCKNKNHWCGFQQILMQDILKEENGPKAAGTLPAFDKTGAIRGVQINRPEMNTEVLTTTKPTVLHKGPSDMTKKFENSTIATMSLGALLSNLQRELIAKQDLLSKVNLSSLPDKGLKLQQQIAVLKQKINEIHVNGVLQEMQQMDIENKENAGAVYKPVCSPKPKSDRFKQMYADHPVYNQLYVGSMNPALRNEIVAVTRVAVEKLHTSLETKPKAEDEVSDPAALTVPLMLHQRQALAWLLWRETQHPPGGILADDMGLGKTLTMIALILKERELEKKAGVTKSETPKDKFLGSAIIVSTTTLVICPASLLHHWESEVKNRCSSGSLSVHIYHGPRRNCPALTLASYDMVVTTYDIVRSEIPVDKEDKKNKPLEYKPPKMCNSPLLKVGFHRIILDEGHVIKNPKTSTNLAVCCLRGGRRWVITGTPIHNTLMDMFSLLKFLRCSPFDEIKVWRYWVANGSNQGQARLVTIVNTLLLRRTKEQTGTDGKPMVSLPSKMIHDNYLTLDVDERIVYDLLFDITRTMFTNYLKRTGQLNAVGPCAASSAVVKSDNLVATKGKGVTLSADIPAATSLAALFVLLLRMQQCCCHLHLLKHIVSAEASAAETEDHMNDVIAELSELCLGDNKQDDVVSKGKAASDIAKQIIEDCKIKLGPAFEKSFCSTKIKALLTTLKKLPKSSESNVYIKSVVVSQWTSLLDIVAHHLDKGGLTYNVISGRIPIPERSRAVDEFNSRTSGPRIMLLSLKAGGVGLNLVGGSHLFLLDVHWNPALESQASDRIHRVGQTQNVHIHRFICNDTVEIKVVALQERKKSLSKNILEGNRAQNLKLSLNDLRMLFGV